MLLMFNLLQVFSFSYWYAQYFTVLFIASTSIFMVQ